MTELIEKYFNTEKIKKIAIEKKYDEISYNEFIRFIDITLADDIRLNSLEVDYENDILEFVAGYMDCFTKEREKGYSVEWAKEYAIQVLYENGEHAIAYAYETAKEHSPEQAQADLKLYCITTRRDELFEKHFKYLLEVDVPNAEIPIEKQAEEYSRIYKEQIKKGSSEIFANHYADLKASDIYSELGCYSEAKEYEKAILAGYSKAYASAFAMDISEYIANNCSSYKESIEDVLVKIEKKKLETELQHLKNI